MLNHVTGNHHTMRPVRRIIAFAAMLLLTIGAASSIVSAKAVYIIDDGNTRTTVESSHALPSAVVEKAGIEVSPAVMAYLVDLCLATRTSAAVRMGVSPRGATALLRTSRVWAFLQGRGFVTPDDVKTMAPVTLAHRLGLRAEANLEGVSATDVITGVLAATPVPR